MCGHPARAAPPPVAMKWLAIAMCVPVVALADPDHVMHWVRGEAIHLANQGGAIHRNDEARIEVTFVSSSNIVVIDNGSKKEHDHVTTWANVWTGTYKISGDEMRAELSLKDRKCSKKWCAPID